MINIAILGSTGSIGTQTLDVVRRYKDEISVKLLGASKLSDTLVKQVIEFSPEFVYIDSTDIEEIHGSKVITSDGIERILDLGVDLYINAISGISGIKPTYILLSNGKKLATANKESVICLGDILKDRFRSVIPIDSEHSAVYQILREIGGKNVRKIILTASGGPFLHKPLADIDSITISDALNHPRWKMGKKITIDSATLMNKGFEVIEAHYIFGFDYDSIDVVVHPESIIHGMVEFVDGTVISNMSCPDMRIPISYAIFGDRRKVDANPLDLSKIRNLNFLKPDFEKFPLLNLAIECGKKGGIYPTVLTVADEIAVNLFLEGKINFREIYKFIHNVVSSIHYSTPKNLEELFELINYIKASYTVK